MDAGSDSFASGGGFPANADVLPPSKPLRAFSPVPSATERAIRQPFCGWIVLWRAGQLRTFRLLQHCSGDFTALCTSPHALRFEPHDRWLQEGMQGLPPAFQPSTEQGAGSVLSAPHTLDAQLFLVSVREGYTMNLRFESVLSTVIDAASMLAQNAPALNDLAQSAVRRHSQSLNSSTALYHMHPLHLQVSSHCLNSHPIAIPLIGPYRRVI